MLNTGPGSGVLRKGISSVPVTPELSMVHAFWEIPANRLQKQRNCKEEMVHQACGTGAQTLGLGAMLNQGPWGKRRYLELTPGFALWNTEENPSRPQRGQALLVEIHANVFVIRPSTPIIHIFSSFLCCRFSLVARSQIKHAVS